MRGVYVIPSGGEPDKRKEESKAESECAVEAGAHKGNDAMDGCYGNPTKQWHGDVLSISLIA